MSLNVDRTGIEGWEDLCFVYMTKKNLSEGETLEGLVNPPERVVENEDGTTTRYIDANPTPWGFHGDGKETIYKLNAVTYCIELGCMMVGIDKITEKNWKEFWTRLHMMEWVNGTLLQGDMFISIQSVRNHIGLVTNASRMSKAEFKRSVARVLRDRTERELRQLLDEEGG
tara:strand:+ start:248 stop:760 length:513 start_codon:yes stop_codon:yes gene_type:complete